MRRQLLALTLFAATPSLAMDVCELYKPIHEKDVLPRIKSGIPFKLLSLAADETTTIKKVVRVEFDLWSESVSVEVLGGKRTTTTINGSLMELCSALSLPVFQGESIRYRLLLNPAIGESLSKLQSKGEGKSGLLEIDWRRLAKDLDSEKTLIESEIKK